MKKPTESVVRLIPSGKKLNDVIENLELVASLSMATLGAMIHDRPEFKDTVLEYLTQLSRLPRLTKHQQQIVRDSIMLVRRFPTNV